MIYLFLYICIGLGIGLFFYIFALRFHKKHPERRGVESMISYIENAPFQYAIYSAFIWPVYLKWFFIG